MIFVQKRRTVQSYGSPGMEKVFLLPLFLFDLHTDPDIISPVHPALLLVIQTVLQTVLQREMKNTSLQHIVLDSCNEAVLAWRKENKNPAFSCFLQEIQKLL